MKVDISFVEDKIKKRGLLYWTVKTKSSNSSGTSYFPSGGGKDDASAEESIEDLNNCLAQIWEYNKEPVIITLRVNAANGRKEGPFILVPDGYEEPEEDEPAPSKTRVLSGVPQAAPALTDAQLEKAGYVPAYVMQFEMDKLRAQIQLDMDRRDFEQEKRDARRKLDDEAAELEAKNAKIDAWGDKASRVAEKLTSNTKLAGNLLGVVVQAGAKVLGVEPTQLETLGAAIFSGNEAPRAQPVHEPARDYIPPAQVVDVTDVSSVGAITTELDAYAAKMVAMMSDPNLSRIDKKRILMFIQELNNKNAQATPKPTPDAPAV